MTKIIAAISHLPVLAMVILAAVFYGKFSRALKIFSWFIFLSGAIQFTALSLSTIGRNNMPLLHIYVAVGLPCLVWFYKTILGNFISTALMWVIVLLFEIFTIFNSLFIQGIFRFNSYALVAESIIIIILALFTFIFLLNNTINEAGVEKITSLTWINSGLFIYYLSCLIIFYFGDTILFRFTSDISLYTWIFHAFFSMIMYSCFITGLWKYLKSQNS